MQLYRHLLGSVFLPAYDGIRSRRYVGHSRFLEVSQWWKPEQLIAFQWAELHKLLRHAFDFVPYYRWKYRAVGASFSDIRTWDDFKRLPRLTRGEIRQHREELCSTAYQGKLLPHATGGSTGVPTRFYRTYESYDWRTAAKDRVYSWPGLHVGDKSVYLWGAPVGDVPKYQIWKTWLHETVQRQRTFNTFSQTEELWWRIHAEICRYRPAAIVGYVSSLQQFAGFLGRTKRNIPRVRGVIAAAEPLFEGVRRTMEEAFEAPVYNTYGSREFMSLAGECEQRDGLHVNSENVVVEAGGEFDEPSNIIVTDLHNYGMPFIRYETGDLGKLKDGLCACGRGLPRLAEIEGRVLDRLRTADGRIVPGEFFPHLLKEIPEFVQYRVEQKDLERIVISAVMTCELSSHSRELLDREIGKVFGGATRCDIQPVEEIPALPSGKRRITIGMAG
ncbi:MAG: phenylacetate--CoA ligase family protein [Acidobacteriia bacterium]|nr:phenylacetate--CoA ligase family protein [Terriglobia bacterium]